MAYDPIPVDPLWPTSGPGVPGGTGYIPPGSGSSGQSMPGAYTVPPLGTGGNTSWTDPGTIAAQGGYGGYSAPSGINPGFALGNLGIEFQRERLNRLEIPSFEWQKQFQGQQLGQQNEQFGRQLTQQESQFARSLGLSDRQLAEMTASREGQQKLQELATRGQLALGGLGLASQEATARGQLGLGNLGLASQEALARRSQGLQAAQAAAETFGGPENAFKQQQYLGMLDGSGGLNFLTGDRGAPLYQAPTGVGQPRDLSAVLGRLADVGGQSPTIDAALAQQRALTTQQTPTQQAAMAMAAPNSEYSTPGSVLQQIPGLGQRYLDAATKASQSNYGVVSDPAQLSARIDQLVRANPEWQRASQTGDIATKTRIERQGFAQAAGLPEDLIGNVYAQTEAYRQANGGQTMPMEQVAQLVQAQAGAVKQRRLQALAQETLGYDPQTAASFVNDWQNQFNQNGNQLPNPADLERDIARRYGYGTGTPPNPMGGTIGQAYTAPATGSGAGIQGPGTMNYSRQVGADTRPQPAQGMQGMQAGQMNYQRQPQMAVDPRPGQAYQAPAMRTQASLGQPAPPQMNPTVALARQTLGNVQAPTQINARNYLRAPESTRRFTLAAGEAGYGWSPQDADEAIRRTLPRAVGPRRGTLVA